MDPILGPRRQKKHTQSYRFPCEYWYGPPGKSQSYPASIPALASHRHRSKVKNYDAICFILANDGWKLFCASRRLWRVYTFAQAYLSLRHCTKISCAASDGDFCSIHPGAKTLVSLHICTGVVTGQCNKYQDLSCEDSDESANLHRLAWASEYRNIMCWLEWLWVCACSWVHIVGLRLTPNRFTDGQRAPFSTINHVRFQSCYPTQDLCVILLLLLLYQGSSQLP